MQAAGQCTIDVPPPDLSQQSPTWCTVPPPIPGAELQQNPDAAAKAKDLVTSFFAAIPLIGSPLKAYVEKMLGVVDEVMGSTGCSLFEGALPWIGRAVLGFVEHWTSIGFSEVIHTLDYYIHNSCPTQIPDIGGTTEAYLSGTVDENTYRSWVRANNFCETPWAKIVSARRTRPNVEQVLDLNLRGFLTDVEADTALRRLGCILPEDRTAFRQFQKELPSPGQLAAFTARGVFDPAIIAKFGYDAEYPEEYKAWMAKQGWNYDLTTPQYPQNGIPEFTWARASWWAHWLIASPDQGIEAFYRLRPTGGPNNGPRDPSGEVFTEKDLEAFLAQHTYSPYWRKKLAALSARTLGIRQIAQLAKFRLASRKELTEYYRDNRYSERTAGLLARVAIRQAQAANWKAETAGARSAIIAAYETGIADRPTTARLLYALQLDDKRLYNEFRNLAVADQTAIALAELPIVIEMDLVDVKLESSLAKSAIASTKRMYLKGRLNGQQAQLRLAKIGLTVGRISQYLRRWEQSLDSEQKELAAGQIQELFRYGIINAETALTYLVNLRYDPNDATLLLLDTERKIALDVAKAEAQAARTVEQKKKAAEAAARAARTEHNRLRSELARHGSPSDLKGWLVAGEIEPQEMIDRLLEIDWPLRDAELATMAAVDTRDAKRQRAGQAVQAAADKAAKAAAAPEAKPSLAELKSWLKDGVATVDDVTKDLTAKGWLPDDIAMQLADWLTMGIPPSPGG